MLLNPVQLCDDPFLNTDHRLVIGDLLCVAISPSKDGEVYTQAPVALAMPQERLPSTQCLWVSVAW